MSGWSLESTQGGMECKVGNMEISVFDFILQMTQSQYQTFLLGDGIVSGKCFVTGKVDFINIQ